MLSIKLKFDDSLLAPIRNLGLTSTKEIDDALQSAALLVEGTVKKKLSRGGRGGRLYSRRGGKISHQASAPGEPPKTDTGRLVSSITHAYSSLQKEIGSNVMYADFLESGTSKMAARPFLKPSLDENEEAINGLIAAAINRLLSP